MGYKVKFCENCRKAYIPTGPRQRYCDSCRPKSYSEKGINALRVAVVKQAKRDGKFERMVETGAAAQLFPEMDQAYLERLAREGKEAEASEAVPEVVPEEVPAVIPEEPAEEIPEEETIETKEEKQMGKNYEQIEDVWEALKAGQEVFAVDFADMFVYSLNGCTIADIRDAMEKENTLFFRERSNA